MDSSLEALIATIAWLIFWLFFAMAIGSIAIRYGLRTIDRDVQWYEFWNAQSGIPGALLNLAISACLAEFVVKLFLP